MPTASTLALGQATYQLLEELEDGNFKAVDKVNSIATADNVRVSQLKSRTATTTTVRSLRNASVDGFGIGEDLNALNYNSFANDNLILQGNFNDLEVSLGAGADTLNILGNVEGAQILMDREGGPRYIDEQYGSFEGAYQANDALNITGNLTSSGSEFSNASDSTRVRNNQIFTGGGNDTVRISGIVEDTDFHLGSGHDSLVIGGDADRVFVGAEGGRDYIEFRGSANDAVVNTGADADTVVFRGQIYGSGFDIRNNSDDQFLLFDSSDSSATSRTAAVELGEGNDSLVVAAGASGVEINTGSGFDTLRLAGSFTDTAFHLDGFLETNFNGADSITVSANSYFESTDFSSRNTLGDTLVVGSNTTLINSNLYFGSGADNLVFGSNNNFLSWDASSVISLGEGADTLVFGAGSSFDGLIINLGGDDDIDVIRFADQQLDPYGLNITGAGEGDILYIGNNQYFYSSSGQSNGGFFA
jgi:hypothetical protein